MALVEYIRQDGTHFVGTLVFIGVVVWGITEIINAINKRN